MHLQMLTVYRLVNLCLQPYAGLRSNHHPMPDTVCRMWCLKRPGMKAQATERNICSCKDSLLGLGRVSTVRESQGILRESGKTEGQGKVREF